MNTEETYVPAPRLSDSETYIPTPRNATIGHFGRALDGRCRQYCLACSDKAQALGTFAPSSPVYGGKPDTGENEGGCDLCGITWEEISVMCQRDHDEQQARWARTSAPTELHEMGCVSGIRCRVY